MIYQRSVSYTHLDVYKRQIWRKNGTERREKGLFDRAFGGERKGQKNPAAGGRGEGVREGKGRRGRDGLALEPGGDGVHPLGDLLAGALQGGGGGGPLGGLGPQGQVEEDVYKRQPLHGQDLGQGVGL